MLKQTRLIQSSLTVKLNVSRQIQTYPARHFHYVWTAFCQVLQVFFVLNPATMTQYHHRINWIKQDKIDKYRLYCVIVASIVACDREKLSSTLQNLKVFF